VGKNQCKLCGTPGAVIVDGKQHCAGCGVTPVEKIVKYWVGKKKYMTFADATFAFERSPFATRDSFGEWLCAFAIEVIAKP